MVFLNSKDYHFNTKSWKIAEAMIILEPFKQIVAFWSDCGLMSNAAYSVCWR
jgi:hypothetical protein